MAVGTPLLMSRSKHGLGPTVPIRTPVRLVVVEGLSPMDSIKVYVVQAEDKPRILDFKNGETYLEEPIPQGSVLRAELIGIDSVVSVWVE